MTSILTLLESSNTLLSNAKMIMRNMEIVLLSDFVKILKRRKKVVRCMIKKGNLKLKMVGWTNFSHRICQNCMSGG